MKYAAKANNNENFACYHFLLLKPYTVCSD